MAVAEHKEVGLVQRARPLVLRPVLHAYPARVVRTALELVLLALAGDGKAGPVQVRITGDRFVALDGTMDLGDSRRTWQLRSGRRVLEGEGFRVRLMGSATRYRVELRVGR